MTEPESIEKMAAKLLECPNIKVATKGTKILTNPIILASPTRAKIFWLLNAMIKAELPMTITEILVNQRNLLSSISSER